MAVYTDITDAELEGFLAEFDLGEALSCKGIAEGVENSNFLVETTGGRFILTIYERRVRAEDLPYFLDLMQWLAQHGFPCAEPMAGRDGAIQREIRGKPAALVQFMNGLSVRRPSAAHCREAGQGMAWLHQAASGFAGRRPNDFGQAVWPGMFGRLEAEAEALKPGQTAWPRSLDRRSGKPSAAWCSHAMPCPASRQWAAVGRRTDSPFMNWTRAAGLPRISRWIAPSRPAIGSAQGKPCWASHCIRSRKYGRSSARPRRS